jgi:acetyltransferase-like isoleucine patch superfamily enzyme
LSTLDNPAVEKSTIAENIAKTCFLPHADIHCGNLVIEGKEISISPGAYFDLTGSIAIGSYCMIGEGTRILTHDHYHEGRRPLLLVQKERGVKWQDKKIGKDVWLHGCTVLYQVTEIPDGVVVGVGAVLTKNPEAYGIYAGNPARKIGER